MDLKLLLALAGERKDQGPLILRKRLYIGKKCYKISFMIYKHFICIKNITLAKRLLTPEQLLRKQSHKLRRSYVLKTPSSTSMRIAYEQETQTDNKMNENVQKCLEVGKSCQELAIHIAIENMDVLATRTSTSNALSVVDSINDTQQYLLNENVHESNMDVQIRRLCVDTAVQTENDHYAKDRHAKPRIKYTKELGVQTKSKKIDNKSTEPFLTSISRTTQTSGTLCHTTDTQTNYDVTCEGVQTDSKAPVIQNVSSTQTHVDQVSASVQAIAESSSMSVQTDSNVSETHARCPNNNQDLLILMFSELAQLTINCSYLSWNNTKLLKDIADLSATTHILEERLLKQSSYHLRLIKEMEISFKRHLSYHFKKYIPSRKPRRQTLRQIRNACSQTYALEVVSKDTQTEIVMKSRKLSSTLCRHH